MKKKTYRRPLNDGPLTAVDKRLEDFGFNLYFSYVFTESVKAHQQLKDKYLEALMQEDYDAMRKLDNKLTIIEGSFEATACMLDATQDNYS